MKTYQKSLYITKTRNDLIDEIADQGYIVLMILKRWKLPVPSTL